MPIRTSAENSGRAGEWSLPNLNQVGMMVRDVERAIAALEQSYGFGPFRVVEMEVNDLRVRGRPPITARGRAGMCMLGPLEVELIENAATRKVGLHHLNFSVRYYDGWLEEMRRRGMPVMQSGRVGNMRFTYYEPTDNSGLVVELEEGVPPPVELGRGAITEARVSNVAGRGVDQIGLVVRSVDRAAESLQRVYGTGPFRFVESDCTDMMVRGERSANIRCRGAFCMLGSLQIELIEPVRGPSVYDEHLASKGEGLHHVGFFVSDYDKRIEEMMRRGLRVLQSGRAGKMRFTYYEPDDSTGLIVEFLEVL